MTVEKLPDNQYKKLVFQLRGQYVAILNVFKCYGMEKDVEQAIDECTKVAENFGMAVRGSEKPIHIYHKPKRRATE